MLLDFFKKSRQELEQEVPYLAVNEVFWADFVDRVRYYKHMKELTI